MNMKKAILLTLLFVCVSVSSYADGVKGDPEVQYKYRFGLDFQIKLAKGLKLNLAPELRFNDGYDNLQLDGSLSYKVYDKIYLGATYRLVIDRVEGSGATTYSAYGFSSNNYDSEVYHRYGFDVSYKDKFGRFYPSLRVRYNNFTDEDIDDKSFLRYRAKVEYDIRKCKITPFVSAEAFQQMHENLLYKMRYSAGFDLKTGKSSSLSFDYKFDYFTLEYKNANIFSAGYKYRF